MFEIQISGQELLSLIFKELEKPLYKVVQLGKDYYLNRKMSQKCHQIFCRKENIVLNTLLV